MGVRLSSCGFRDVLEENVLNQELACSKEKVKLTTCGFDVDQAALDALAIMVFIRGKCLVKYY